MIDLDTANLDAIGRAVSDGFIPAHIYNDTELFEYERDRLFATAWVFVAHESEIPSPSDFVVRRIVDDSFIISRSDDGEVRAMFNMCLHRGMQVCRAEKGTAKTHRCPYHNWIYASDGRLVGLPFHVDAYGGEEGFVKDDQRLLPAPSLAIYNGLIFMSLDPDAPPLLDYLGDFAYYLDLYTKQSKGGLELRGPQRWRVNANWKIGCENFIGDSYHTPHTHASVVDIGLFGEPKPNKRKEGVLYHAGRGGGTTYKLPTTGFREGLSYVGYPEEMIDRMQTSWSAPQQDLIGSSGFMHSAATLFPNLSLVHNWPQVDDSGTVTPFISLRLWHPISESETEVLSWFAVDSAAPEDFKERSYKAYLMCFGSSGMFEQDDIENWASITTTAKGTMARRLLLNGRMGLDRDNQPLVAQYDDFSGPGVAFQGYGEHNQRHWLGMWNEAIQTEPRPVAVVAPGAPEGSL